MTAVGRRFCLPHEAWRCHGGEPHRPRESPGRFFLMAGPLLLDFMPRGATINAYSYCGTLAYLRAAIYMEK
jgi:hypothetical protein